MCVLCSPLPPLQSPRPRRTMATMRLLVLLHRRTQEHLRKEFLFPAQMCTRSVTHVSACFRRSAALATSFSLRHSSRNVSMVYPSCTRLLLTLPIMLSAPGFGICPTYTHHQPTCGTHNDKGSELREGYTSKAVSFTLHYVTTPLQVVESNLIYIYAAPRCAPPSWM